MLTNLPQSIVYSIASFLEHQDLLSIRKISPELKLAADTFGSMREMEMVIQRYLSPTPALNPTTKQLVARHVRPNHASLYPMNGVRVLAVEYQENDFGDPAFDLMFMYVTVYYLDSKGEVYRSTRGFWFSRGIECLKKENPFAITPYLGDLVFEDGIHDGLSLGGQKCKRECIV